MIILFCSILLLFGIACFIACVCGADSLLCIMASGLFFLYLFPCLHELGHVVGCKLTKAKVAKIHLLFFTIEDGKAKLSKRLLPFKVSFYSGKKDYLVYLCGILASLLIALLCGALYAIFQTSFLLPPCILSALVLICNLIGKQGDLSKTLHCLKNGE